MNTSRLCSGDSFRLSLTDVPALRFGDIRKDLQNQIGYESAG